MTNTDTPSTTSKIPTHSLYVVNEHGSGKPQWIKVASAWPNKDGNGFNLKLDGNLVLRVNTKKDA